MTQTVNKKNLRQLCWKKGFHGVTGFAAHIKRSRVTVHRAVTNPRRFSPTFKLIEEILL